VKSQEPSAVVHTCNPSYLGGGGKRIRVRGWPGKKQQTLYQQQDGHGPAQRVMPITPANQEVETGGSQFEASLGKKLADPISINMSGVVAYASDGTGMGS
jgi:hypothetical protein